MRALGCVGGDRLVGRNLHPGIERGPDIDRIRSLVDQRVELRQSPIGEITHAILVAGLLDADFGGIGGGGGRLADEAVLGHGLKDDGGAGARRLDVGGRRVIGRRLDQTSDDRCLAQAQMVGAMAEKAT